MHKFPKTVFLITAALSFMALAVAAEDLNAVRSRMEARLAAIDQLKAAQAIGENNEGYLTLLKDQTAANRRLVEDENKDRLLVYEEIADKTRASAAVVARRRAERIRAMAVSGSMIQESDGTWKAK